VKKMVEACLASRIDVLVNNVGGSAHGGLAEISEEVWDAEIDQNLESVFLTCKHVLPIRQRQASGPVVNIASTSGVRWTEARFITGTKLVVAGGMIARCD
jgi:NAD(P)-dependent dehydrogenase (short-subunit alcohol dehydrogenase family)